MRAIVMDTIGKAELLRWKSHEEPKPKASEVLVQVHATSLNSIDCKTRKGDMPRFLIKLPKILGGDVAGLVIESNSEKFPIGSKVMGLTQGFQIWNPWGTYAELTTACEDHLVNIPDNLTMQEAAGIPLVSITAYMALDACGTKTAGKKLLIQGGAGGCGSMCIQLAKLRGFEITVTCSGRNIDFVKSLGADHAIDYKVENFWERNDRYDAVIDFVGGDAEINSLKVIRRDGTFVSVLSSSSILRTLWQVCSQKTKSLLGLGPAYKIIMVHPDGRILQNLADYLQAGRIRPVIDKIMPLEDAAAAHQYMEQGKNSRGKVILTVK